MKEKNDAKKNESQPKRISSVETLSVNLTRSIGTPISILVHTILFVGIFALKKFGVSLEQILLILTTVVSLEAIYLAIFIQMTINRQEEKLHEVSEDIEEISEDIEDIQEDVEELGEDFEEFSDDLEEDDKKEEAYRSERNQNLQKMETTLQSIIAEIEKMKTNDTGRRNTDRTAAEVISK
jgi:uncharacterized protein YoxC